MGEKKARSARSSQQPEEEKMLTMQVPHVSVTPREEELGCWRNKWGIGLAREQGRWAACGNLGPGEVFMFLLFFSSFLQFQTSNSIISSFKIQTLIQKHQHNSNIQMQKNIFAYLFTYYYSSLSRCSKSYIYIYIYNKDKFTYCLF
jgi:hypothetical protein